MIIGIDPGQKGGIAFIINNEVTGSSMPLVGKELDIQTIVNMIEYNRHREEYNTDNLAIVEKVHSMPKQGVASSFKFGKNYGTLLGILGTLAIPVQLVTPQAWKKLILAGTKKDKNAAIEYVSMKYPDFKLIRPGCRKPHDGICDAICIAEYGRRQQK